MVIESIELKKLIEELRKEQKSLVDLRNQLRTLDTTKETLIYRLKLLINKMIVLFDVEDIHKKRTQIRGLIAANKRRIKTFESMIKTAFV